MQVPHGRSVGRSVGRPVGRPVGSARLAALLLARLLVRLEHEHALDLRVPLLLLRLSLVCARFICLVQSGSVWFSLVYSGLLRSAQVCSGLLGFA